ncbi:MAG: ADP-ribosylglycohydrolase family protein [Phycisphaeraceae bacterium]
MPIAPVGSTLQDRFRGALVGTMVGDALGMPVEGRPASMIRAGGAPLREMLDARLGRGTYTDDTQMTLALAEALVETRGHVDLDRIAQRFTARYEPDRGYGGNTHHILSAIQRGEPWPDVVERYRLPGGSFANGAAMRVAPVALACYGDAPRVAEAAERQAEVTGHTHSIGLFGARLQALAVHEALKRGPGFSIRAFYDRFADDEVPEEFGAALDWIAAYPHAPPDEAAAMIGVGGVACESVPAALWAFVAQLDDPEAIVVCAVNLGGDADTIGAMAGALAGAAHGASALPERWLDALENGAAGRDHAVTLADQLFFSHR